MVLAVIYTEAPEVAEIAKGLIEKYHQHLLGEDIEYVYRDKAAMKGDKVKLGTARKVSALPAFLSRQSTDPYFLMEIARDEWLSLDAKQREALVDHELCHFGVTEDGSRYIIPHDLEEFTAVVQRHGLWRPEVARMVNAGQGS